MYFIVRAMFWIGIVVLLLPVGGDAQFKTADALDAARSAVADLSGFCERNPGTCETGAKAVSAFGHKMAESAKWAYALARDEDYVPSPEAETRTVRTIPFSAQGFTHTPQQTVTATEMPDASRTTIVPTSEPNTTVLQRGTLTPADSDPVWQGGQRI